MKRLALAVAVCLSLLAALPGMTLAVPPGTLDQHQDTVSSSMGGGTWAQIFTVGVTGNLTGIQLYINGEPGTITASIRATAGGVPTGADLRSIAATSPTTAGWVDFTFASTLPVTSGQVLAIVIVMDAHSACWGSATNVYAGPVLAWNGEGWITPTVGLVDFGFRTYVQGSGQSTPPPTGSAAPTRGSGPDLWFLPAALILCLLGSIVTVRRASLRVR